jgi:hypothetical protein
VCTSEVLIPGSRTSRKNAVHKWHVLFIYLFIYSFTYGEMISAMSDWSWCSRKWHYLSSQIVSWGSQPLVYMAPTFKWCVGVSSNPWFVSKPQWDYSVYKVLCCHMSRSTGLKSSSLQLGLLWHTWFQGLWLKTEVNTTVKKRSIFLKQWIEWRLTFNSCMTHDHKLLALYVHLVS